MTFSSYSYPHQLSEDKGRGREDGKISRLRREMSDGSSNDAPPKGRGGFGWRQASDR
jgi:hypothetical protein